MQSKVNQITGSPTVFRAGRSLLLVSYVSVGEWQTFGALWECNKRRAVIDFLYYSLHRGDPTVTRRAVRWWAFFHRKAQTDLMELIFTISLPKPPKGKPETTESPAEADRNMKTAYRVLAKMYGWTAAEISDMSPAQIFSFLSGGKDGTGIVKMTSEEYQSFRARQGLN